MSFKVLAPKYYLSHFFEFLDFVETHYAFIFEPSHADFVTKFRSLSEDAQCCYIRMVNRKGNLFDLNGFQKYVEIENFRKSLDELKFHQFSEVLKEDHVLDLLYFLQKPKLKKWLSAHDLVVPTQFSRDEMVDLGRRNIDRLTLNSVEGVENLVVQARTHELEYLTFLFFGRIQKSLTLYTLRDLGIREISSIKSKFKPRFNSAVQARAEYFFARQLEEHLHYLSFSQIEELVAETETFSELTYSAQALKDELLWTLADHVFDVDPALGLRTLEKSRHPEARQRIVRHSYKVGEKELCLAVLAAIQDDPRSDEELLFAEDFLSRKLSDTKTSRKVGYLTEVLRNAGSVTLSDFYLRRPEQGVIEMYKNLGYDARFTENHLWTSLFGVLFWDELFDSENAAIHNPFERSPADLIGPEFYNRFESSIEDKLNALNDVEKTTRSVLKTIAMHHGRLNDLFQWHVSLPESLLAFVKNARGQNLAHVLRTMAKKFGSYHSGYPDLMIEKEGAIRFVEVKAEGDSLRAHQLSKIKLLREAGFGVDVLKVQWMTDPHQIYVVVDVETTGGTAGFHRVTEIGAVKVQDGKVIDEFQTLINPGRPIPPFITGITGITNDMVASAPTFNDIAESFLAFMKGGLFVAHNVKFDYGFIQREFARVGIEFTRPHLCTCAGMRKAFPGIPSYGLKNLTTHFNIPLDQHHRALSDARAAAALLLLMNEKRKATVDTDHSV